MTDRWMLRGVSLLCLLAMLLLAAPAGADDLCTGFFELPPFDAGLCATRPAGTVCLGFADGYLWLVPGGVLAREFPGVCFGETVDSAQVSIAGVGVVRYLHVLDTNLVRVEGPPFCGNATVDPAEECDDGSVLDGDGCAADCTLEPTFFMGLGDFPVDIRSDARAVSANGSVVVGTRQRLINGLPFGLEGFRWENGVRTFLNMTPQDVSEDGSVIVGRKFKAARWENGIVTELGILPGQDPRSLAVATGVSADGSVVVGTSGFLVSELNQAFRWENGVMTALDPGVFLSESSGVSADGSVVVGLACSAHSLCEAFRWTADTGLGLGFLDSPSSRANAISADGFTIVGSSRFGSETRAFRWEQGVMTNLGVLPGHNFSRALAVSADGSVVVGESGSSSSLIERFASIWTAGDGIRDLKSVLVDDLGLDLTGWSLPKAEDISADGLTIIGTGINPSGQTEGWLAQLAPSNSPPLADAGDDSEMECTSPEGALVLLDGSGSTDPDSTPGTNNDIVLFEWFEDFGLPTETFLGSEEILTALFPLGPALLPGETPMVTGSEAVTATSHLVTLHVTDAAGATDTDDVTIVVTDTTPPEVSVFTFPMVLWPPNHRLVPIDASVPADDACGPTAVVLSSVTSDEPDNGTGIGDGNTTGDIRDVDVGTEDFDFRLRAERAGTGDGRVYSVVYTATDMAGNEASATAAVFVPHNQNGVTEPMMMSVAEKPAGTTLEWNDVEGALYYNVIRGDLAGLQETDASIDLGNVNCLKATSLTPHTVGWEDSATPASGDVFFYLVEYFDGWNTSYGTASAAMSRTVTSGACK